MPDSRYVESEKGFDSIVLGGGCFWCVEACLLLLEGVVSVVPGYAGGETPDPTYRQVCGGLTGHAEVVRVSYDPNKSSLDEVLDVFFASHDPTSLNRQGADVGTQYRSIILHESDEQRELVEDYIERIRPDYDRPIVTEIKELDTFYPAEDYHRRYYEENQRQPYCQMVIAPKVKKIKQKLV